MPSFYREQKTAHVKLWKNISSDHGKALNLSIEGERPFLKEELEYINNMGFPVSTMNSTGLRVEHNSINSVEVPKGFLIIFKYKISASAIGRFRNFIFNTPADTINPVMQELVRDFNSYYARQKNQLGSYRSDYNFDFVMLVTPDELSAQDTVYIPECNTTLTSKSVLEMPNNPTLAMRFNQKPVRVYACEEFKDNYKIATTVQSVAPDHVPDSYFYFMGKIVQQTESVRRPESEEGIVIITHEFDEFNTRFNVVEKFIPTSEVLENGFFRTKQDLLSNGDCNKVIKQELEDNKLKIEQTKISLEQLKLKNEEAKIVLEDHKQELELVKQQTERQKLALEEKKLSIRNIELSTESIKIGTEQKRQIYENQKYSNKNESLALETQLQTEKFFSEMLLLKANTLATIAGLQMKHDSAVVLNELDESKAFRKHEYETLSFERDIQLLQEKTITDREKVQLDLQTNRRKNVEEGVKTVQTIASMVKLLF